MSRILWSYNGTSKGMTAGIVSLDASKRVGVTQYNATYNGRTYSVYTFTMSSANGSSISNPINTWSTSEQIGDQNTWTTWISGSLAVKIQAYHSANYTYIGLRELSLDGVLFRVGGNYPQIGQGLGRDAQLGIAAYRGIFNDEEGIYLSFNLSTWTQQSEFIKGDSTIIVGWLFIPDEVLAFASTQDPYSPSNDTSAGDPSESGGYGAGFPDGNKAKTDTTKGSIFPFGAGLHAYVITPAQLATLSSFLWGRVSTVFDPGGLWAKFQNYKFNPIAGVLTCHSLPLALMPASGGSATIAIAGTDLSGASGAPCSTHFTKYTSNFVSIPEPYASFVDYAYPSFAVHIPFCGVVPIDVSAIMGGGIYVRIFCDVVSGNVGAWIIGRDRNGNEQLLKVATGNCAYQVPITGNDNGTSEIVGSLKQAVAGGFSGSASSMLSAGFNIVSGLQRHNTETVGSYCGNVGYCGSEEIFLICNWPYPIYTNNYSRERGRPSEYSGTVGSFSGYAELEVHADSISVATDEERQEIENVLRSGVII